MVSTLFPVTRSQSPVRVRNRYSFGVPSRFPISVPSVNGLGSSLQSVLGLTLRIEYESESRVRSPSPSHESPTDLRSKPSMYPDVKGHRVCECQLYSTESRIFGSISSHWVLDLPDLGTTMSPVGHSVTISTLILGPEDGDSDPGTSDRGF